MVKNNPVPTFLFQCVEEPDTIVTQNGSYYGRYSCVCLGFSEDSLYSIPGQSAEDEYQLKSNNQPNHYDGLFVCNETCLYECDADSKECAGSGSCSILHYRFISIPVLCVTSASIIAMLILLAFTIKHRKTKVCK